MASDRLSGSVPPSSSSYPSSSNKGSEAGSQIKTKAAELSHAAASQIDSSRGTAASGIASAAASLHDHAEDLPGGERVANLAHSAADKMSSTADYIRDHDMDAMVQDVKALVKKNPGPALLGAVVLGVLLGRAFSSRD
ncbi:MAG: hypothetical protein M3O26_06030 [Pseudomonadota bacterium]|nr:hypothetical protein [Pseudomonadota bacterium]